MTTRREGYLVAAVTVFAGLGLLIQAALFAASGTAARLTLSAFGIMCLGTGALLFWRRLRRQ